MNKEEIQKRIVEVERTIDSVLAKAIMLNREQMNELNSAYSEMERLQFQLKSLDDDAK